MTQAEALDPVEPLDERARNALSTTPAAPPPRVPSPRAPIERREVLPVAGSDRLDAGIAEPSKRAARHVEAAPADAAAPAEPPSTLPLVETVPFAEPTPGPRPPDVAPSGETCGFIICTPGFGCCNPSCGLCVAPGETCSQEPCR